MATLTVISQPDAGRTGPVRPADEIALDKDAILIGRHPPDCGIDLQLPDLCINRQHAKITRAEGAYWIEDLKSRIGTSLNQAPLTYLARLQEGDVIQIGSYSLRFRDDAKLVAVDLVSPSSRG